MNRDDGGYFSFANIVRNCSVVTAACMMIRKNVFEKNIQNFQYPSANQYFKLNFTHESPILAFENQQPFISKISTESEDVYWINSPLNNEDSNFQNFPLIVPVFYNIGVYSYQFPELYYTIGKENIVEVIPDVGGGVAGLTALLVNLPAGIGLWLFDKITGEQFNSASAKTYEISGSWDKPEVNLVDDE